ncbi:MAG: GH92 family glycosyl hydrolase [Nocardiopsaceae bacterium]|nr:GH92 family glycosyl hydrolase [Nocardiopsaceae bacterium]
MRLGYALIAGAAAAYVSFSGLAPASASSLHQGGTASAPPAAAADPASLVNPLIGTGGSGDTFPGPDMPFGMMQWGPDTAPTRPDGGGYSYAASQVAGYSLTHLSGPGCGAYGDVPILPTTGAVGSNPAAATETFSHSEETARAGYYASTLGDGVAVKLTDATRSGIGTFSFPSSTRANLLLKLDDSQDPVDSATERVIGDDEVAGSVTAGHFCDNPNPLERSYTLHFNIVFSQPFTATSTWNGTSDSGSAIPGGVALTFNTTKDRTVTAKAGISFTSDANAAANREAEIPGWDFGAVRHANVAAWNAILGRIQVAGGSPATEAEFYTALYHSLLSPNVFSDVNGQYTGSDGKIHSVVPGHADYANFSGWDTYRGQAELEAMVAPAQASDTVTSMLDDYAQSGMLPKWSLGNGETFTQAGDPADAIIAGSYAFGARGFDARTALKDMITEATSSNDIRPGQATLGKDGYLPFDGSYGCCNFYGPVSTQLEYDTDDYAIASFARATGDAADYKAFATRAQNWENVYNPQTGYVQARMANGTWLGDFSPGTPSGFIEGTSAQYTPMVPFALRKLITAEGGDHAWVKRLNGLTSNLTSPGPANADLSNEPSLEIPYEYDYAGAPYRTQQVVREAERQLYSDAPSGIPGNDDLGALSAAYVWDSLGFSPQTPGTPVLALGSPAFPRIVINGKIRIYAPGAGGAAGSGGGNSGSGDSGGSGDAGGVAATNPYVHGLSLDGHPWNAPWVDFGALSHGATLSYRLGSRPDAGWGSSIRSAPPSDLLGGKAALTSAGPASGLILAPGSSGTGSVTVENLTSRPVTAAWSASPPSGVTLGATSGKLAVPANGTATARFTVTAGSKTGSYPVRVSAAGDDSALNVDVAKPGDAWPYYNDVGVSSDGQDVPEGYDGAGYTYSSNALAADGVKPGGTLSAGGLRYTWPDEQPGTLDSIWSAGQTVPLSLPSGSTRIGLLGSAIDAGSGGATGTLTVTYTDGSTQAIPVTFADWTLGAGAYPLPPSDVIAATTGYRNLTSGGSQPVKTYIYATSAALQSGKTVASVTLPTGSGGDIGIFAIGSN